MPAFDLELVRDGGLTHVLDKGLGPRGWEDVLETSGDYIDIVKLGWGTAYVTKNLERKLEVLQRQARRHRRHVLRGRLREGQARRVQAVAHGASASTTSRSPTARSRSRASGSSS